MQKKVYNYFFDVDHAKSLYDTMWFGLRDPSGENDWAWSDGTEYEFTDWYQNNPNDVGERCGYVSIHFIHLLIHLNYLISFKMFNISNCEICEI